MAEGVLATHESLKIALKEYIVAQYLRRTPVLLEALEGRLEQENVLFREPYIESSPAYESVPDGLSRALLPDWMKDFFSRLSREGLGVYANPFRHQVSALEQAVAGKDLFVSTGTGSGKTECFMWPLMATLAREAHDSPKTWEDRGVRCIIMYPMNALVSDQVSRLRRLLGDHEGRFLSIFRQCTSSTARRPQFGMYTGRTPYPGPESRLGEDQALAKTLSRVIGSNGSSPHIEGLRKQGRIPAKEDLAAFVAHLRDGRHVTDPEDAELITRFEMQATSPDILITNYSMLEYLLFRPREKNIWEDTRKWLDLSQENRLLFVIDEAHMYKGASGGEVALLLRRLFHKLGIQRERVQFILTTASMPDACEEDRLAVREFAGRISASSRDDFCYITGEKKDLPSAIVDIEAEHIARFQASDIVEGAGLVDALNDFWQDFRTEPAFSSCEAAEAWLFDHLVEYRPFRELMRLCRGTAVSLSELATGIFPDQDPEAFLPAVDVLLAMAALARKDGNVLFPVRAHMMFRGIQGLYACSNSQCPHAHEKGGLTLGDVFLSSGHAACKHCGSMVYELYNDRRCGALFFKGYIIEDQFQRRGRTFLWRLPGKWMEKGLKEIHLYIAPAGYLAPKTAGKYKTTPCYLDVRNGFLHIGDDSLSGKADIRKLYYCPDFEDKGRPDLKTFHSCPHCGRRLGVKHLTGFSTRGNFSFFSLIRAQFEAQPPVLGRTERVELPNEGRKVLLFSDSRQGAAKLARDMSDASDSMAARQLFALAMREMANEQSKHTMNELYGYFALEAARHNVRMFSGADRLNFWTDCETVDRRARRGRSLSLEMESAPPQMKIQFLKQFCGGYNTITDTAMAWIEPDDNKLNEALDDLEDQGIKVSRQEFLELFNAWMLDVCRDWMALDHQISDAVREELLLPFHGCGLKEDWEFSRAVQGIMGWKKNDPAMKKWRNVLEEHFLDRGVLNRDRQYVNLKRVCIGFDPEHVWYRCARCSELTAFPFLGKCPSCGNPKLHTLDDKERGAMELWKRQMDAALEGAPIRIIDTEEHTAQLSYKDQRDAMWSRTEEYELRFQDILEEGDAPVDILSSTTTMEVGIDIGSLVAVGLRNMPPLRENYQQRAGRAGRRGAALSTIVTFCENGPHDTLYFQDPSPMFRGDPRRPWIDTLSPRLLHRHLAMVSLQRYFEQNGLSGLDEFSAAAFVDSHFETFFEFLGGWPVTRDGILLDRAAEVSEDEFRQNLQRALEQLREKCRKHPEFYTPEGRDAKPMSLLDALYEESVIPTYSFPKNVVSVNIMDEKAKLRYQVSRGLDIAISEYAPGRSIVVDKNTYQIGGLYSYHSEQRKIGEKKNWLSPARPFFEDHAYLKPIVRCHSCNWFGLASDDEKCCPFCGEKQLEEGRPMLRPWGFAPTNAESTSVSRLDETYSWAGQPLYSTLPSLDNIEPVEGCTHLRMANRPGQRIIMINDGGEKGFVVCQDCGAAVPTPREEALKGVVKRPYRLPFSKPCYHADTMKVDLGYDFITDMLVLECTLDRLQLDTRRSSPWLERAAQSLAEVLRLQVSQKLDIEFTELVSGYRIRESGQGVFVDLYLYDSLSSGAGYAVGLAPRMGEILRDIECFLSQCSCDDACQQCLKHYRNRHVHGLLDRFAALDLLRWAMTGKRAAPLEGDVQAKLLSPFASVLNEVHIQIEKVDEKLFLSSGNRRKELEIYPAMWLRPSRANLISIKDMDMKHARPVALREMCEAFGDR